MPPSAPPSRAVVVLERNLRRALEQRSFDDAEAILARLREAAPLALGTRGLELELLLARSELERADALAGQLLELFPASPRVQFLAGEVAYRRREYARAAERFEESAKLHAHWRSRHWLGKALTQLGRFEEAERILVELAERHVIVQRDLAWLHQRRGEPARARRAIERFLEAFPSDALARAELLRLEAKELSPSELVAEVEGMVELGEGIPDALLPGYARALVELGRQDELRRFLVAVGERLAPRVLGQIGWELYHLALWDLAYALLVRTLPARPGDVKLLRALEKCARMVGKRDELARLYESLASEQKNLYGRARELRKAAKEESGSPG